MTDKKINYDKIAPYYDKTRRGGGPYLATLVDLARKSGARQVLDIGAGTGNNTLALLEEYPCQLIGVDVSAEMLARAKGKNIDAHLMRASVLDLPLPNGAVDFVFGVYVLHHIPEFARAIRECGRVLREGCAAFVTASHDFIDRHVMNRYFPSFAAIDKARFQTLEELRTAFYQAGFTTFGHAAFLGEPHKIDRDYLEKVENKALSTCELMPPDEYTEGLARLRADVEHQGVVGTIQWESLLIWANKENNTG